MLIRSLVSILIVASSFVLAAGQTLDAQKKDPDKAAKTSNAGGTEKLRDIPLPGGVNLQFLIKELARDMDLNVLFDPESRLEARSVRIELKNVTVAESLNYILLQEGLISEEAGPKTILVATRLRATSIPQIGVGITPLTAAACPIFWRRKGIAHQQRSPRFERLESGTKGRRCDRRDRR